MKIISIDKVNLLPIHIKKLKKAGDLFLFDNTPDSKQEAINRVKQADILLVNLYKISKDILVMAKQLKMIAVFGTGFDFIDIKEAKKKNILVCNAPNYCTESAAEHTIGLILNAIRLASRAERDLRKGIWSPHVYKGYELKGKTLGIIGYGNIGKRVGEIASRGLNMKIRHINSSSNRKNLEMLLRKSDVISINTSLNNKTFNMIEEKEFSLMKEGVVIINTGRASVINNKELVKNLKLGKIFAVGLDVFKKEPIKMTDSLLSFTNVVLTPHMAFKTKESEYRISQTITDNVTSFIKGNPQNIVK